MVGCKHEYILHSTGRQESWEMRSDSTLFTTNSLWQTPATSNSTHTSTHTHILPRYKNRITDADAHIHKYHGNANKHQTSCAHIHAHTLSVYSIHQSPLLNRKNHSVFTPRVLKQKQKTFLGLTLCRFALRWHEVTMLTVAASPITSAFKLSIKWMNEKGVKLIHIFGLVFLQHPSLIPSTKTLDAPSLVQTKATVGDFSFTQNRVSMNS